MIGGRLLSVVLCLLFLLSPLEAIAIPVPASSPAMLAMADCPEHDEDGGKSTLPRSHCLCILCAVGGAAPPDQSRYDAFIPPRAMFAAVMPFATGVSAKSSPFWAPTGPRGPPAGLHS